MAFFLDDVLFVIFSNKMEACKREFSSINRPRIFIEEHHDYHDSYLMSMCTHHIIANSSFSWWDAYLNPNPNKIVMTPPRWYTPCCELDDKDIVPLDWFRIQL